MNSLSKALTTFDNQVDMKKTPLPLKPCNYALVGKKGSGKTTLMLNLLTKKQSPYYKFFDRIFLISPTARKDDKMKELVDDLEEMGQYFEELDNEVLQHILDVIDSFNEEWKQKKKKGKPAHLLILDDCVHMMKRKSSKLLEQVITQNRHFNLFNWILIQKWTGYMPTIIRSNLDNISFFRNDNKKELESFLDEMNGNPDELRALYDYAVSEPFSFFHINNYGDKPYY